MIFLQAKMDKTFLVHYKNFKNFKEEEYKAYWDLCFMSLENRDFVTYAALSNEKKTLLDFNPINDLIYYDKIDQMMFELEKENIEKYREYFLSLNTIYTPNSMSEFIISFYGDELNWDVILTNTLYEEVDREPRNNRAFDLIANFHEIMFSTEIENDKYVPAQASLFFKCLELGAEIPYNYMRDSIYRNNTTFLHKLTELFRFVCLLWIQMIIVVLLK